MTGLDPERVVSVYSAETGTRGSGYSLHQNLVLTAAHCVGPEGSAVDVRPLRRTRSGSYRLSDAVRYRVAVTGNDTRGGPDLALLVGPSPTGPPGQHPPPGGPGRWRNLLGRVAGTRELPVTTLAFPALQEDGGVVNLEHIQGVIAPLTGAREAGGPRRLELQVGSGAPRQDRPRVSSWEGASGAAVFSGDYLVGVLVQDRQQIEGRLTVTPLTGLFGERGVDAANRYLVEAGSTEGSPVVLYSVWSGGDVLERPYEPLPYPPSFTDLLQPRFGTVRFTGRAAELDRLTDWYRRDTEPDGGRRLRAKLLVGDGAVGKTRLARELCHRANQRGWTAGMLSPIAAHIGESLAGLDEDLLIAIDDADARAGQLDALLAAADRLGTNAHLRVLAVARQPGDWWAELGRRYDAVESRADQIVHLGPPSVDERYDAYSCALQQFRSDAFRLLFDGRRPDEAEAGGEPGGAQRPEIRATSDLAGDDFASYLLVVMQALVDASASVATGVRGRDEAGVPASLELRLLDRLLDLEHEAWGRTVDPWLSADPVLLERIVAVASLAYADDSESVGQGETEAAATLRLVPDLADAPEQVRRASARWERRLYAGYGYLRALRPEQLAQHVAANLVAAFPSLAIELLDLSQGNALAPAGDVAKSYRAVNTLRLLSNAAFGETVRPAVRRHVADALGLALKAHTRTLLRLSLGMVSHDLDTRSDTAGKSLIAALESTIMRFPETGAARDAAEVLEEDCPDVLLPLAVKVLQRATGVGAPGPATGPTADPLTHARLLRILSRFLSDSGQKQQAPEVAWEAVQEARGLERRSTTPETQRLLADALSNLAVRLDEVGRYQEAVDAGHEAVDRYDALVRADPSRWSHVRLATGYSNLSLAAGHLGRWREALQWATQARDLLDRELPPPAGPDDDPGDALLAAKALASHMACRYWAAADRHQDAIAAAKQAVAGYETLSRAKPAVWTRDYARATNTLGRRYADSGEWDSSIECHERAVRSYSKLEQQYREAVRGEDADAHRDLAASYFCRYLAAVPDSAPAPSRERLGADAAPPDRRERTDLAESRRQIGEAVRGYRQMTPPDQRARLRGYALALRWMARIAVVGEYDDATALDEAAGEPARRAVQMYRQLHNPTHWDERRLAFARLVNARVLLAFAHLDRRPAEQVRADLAAARAEREAAESRIRELDEEEAHATPEDIAQLRAELDALLTDPGSTAAGS